MSFQSETSGFPMNHSQYIAVLSQVGDQISHQLTFLLYVWNIFYRPLYRACEYSLHICLFWLRLILVCISLTSIFCALLQNIQGPVVTLTKQILRSYPTAPNLDSLYALKFICSKIFTSTNKNWLEFSCKFNLFSHAFFSPSNKSVLSIPVK